MYVRIRHLTGTSKTDLIFVISKTSTIRQLKESVFKRLNLDVDKQKLYYNGKLLVDEHTILDYSIRLNDVIQLMEKYDGESMKNETVTTNEIEAAETEQPEEPAVEVESRYYKKGDLIDVIDDDIGGWFEAKIIGIFDKPDHTSSDEGEEADLIFKIQMESNRNEEVAPINVTFSDIRPRSYYTFPTAELKPDMVVLVNYNIEEPKERGYWYDFKVVDSTRKVLKGTLLLGKGQTVMESISIKFNNEAMRIEQVTLLSDRNGDEEENATGIALRKVPFYCKQCMDNPKKNCKSCGCHICSKKTDPKSLLMCDECDRAFHLSCLDPPLTEVPSDPEWYCRECKIDDSEIVKAGEKLKPSNKKQKMASTKNKENGKNRDWGQGMACVGRTSVCTIVPLEHSGPVPGIEVGTCWKFRIQVSEAGIHRPHVAGIHGREADGAYSIVLSGGYEDDIDNGNEFYYTGSGGRDLSGNKRISEQSSNQELTRMNKALALNCNVKFNNQTGGEAKDWKKGKPVRVVRNYKLAKHSKYAPKDGNRYDGIYKVVKYYPEKGKSGFIVWRYLLRRDDPSPAPWAKNGQEFPIILPPGYLEAQEIKNNNATKKRKSLAPLEMEKMAKIQKIEPYHLTKEMKSVIDDDLVNQKAWEECFQMLKEGKQKFLAKIEELFLCVCCQDLVFEPITTACAHNVCQKCLQRSFEANIRTCPSCRFELDKTVDLEDINMALSETLRTLFPGYEIGR